MGWVKQGGTQAEFSQDRYSCMQNSQQRVGGASFNQFGGYAANQVVTNEDLFAACMNSRGWYWGVLNRQPASSTTAAPTPTAGLTSLSSQPAQKSPDEKLRDLHAELDAEQKAICKNKDYALIVAKSACKTSEISGQQFADPSKIREPEKIPFIKMRTETEGLQRRSISGTEMWGRTISVPWSEAMKRSAAAQSQLTTDLLAGKITWGAYNVGRRDISKAYREDVDRLRAAR